MVSASTATVATPCLAYIAMRDNGDWDLIDALCAGTRKMRADGDKWMPREDAESHDAFKRRLKRSFLYEILKDTRRRLASKPFSRPVTLPDPLPDRLAGMDRNVDAQGQSLTAYAKQLFDETTKRGVVHTLVEYPDLGQPGETVEQRQERISIEAEFKVHPFFTMISADNLIGWDSRPDPEHGRFLTEIRFSEWVVEKDPQNPFAESMVEQFRVVRQWTWEIWRRGSGKNSWAIWKQGTSTLGEVPLRTWYTNRTGYMTAESPLRALAWLNLAHYQSSSDQNNILRFYRLGILFGSGFTDDERDKSVVLGPARMIRAKNPDAKLSIVEGTGASIGAGRQDLLDIEARAEVLGLAPLMERTGDVTATGRAIDESKNSSDILAWIIAGEAHLRECFELAAKWVSSDVLAVELSDKFKVDIFSDFTIGVRAKDDIDSLLKMRLARQITHLTFLKEVRRRSMLGEDVDPAQEAEGVKVESGVDGLTGADDGDDDGGGGGAREAA